MVASARALAALAAAGLALAGPCAADMTAQAPLRERMDAMSAEIGRLAQTSGDWGQQKRVEEAVAAEVRTRIKADPAHPSLVDKTKSGSTVLMHASLNGYALVVEALLESPAVQRELEASNATGATAWALANFAFKQTAWVCSPSALDPQNPFLASRYIIQSLYFSAAPENPYARIRSALANAGARQDLEAAKKAWVANCPPATADTVAKVNDSRDLLKTLLSEAEAKLARFKQPAASGAAANSER